MTTSLKSTKSNQAVLQALQKLNHATVQEITDWLQLTQPHTKVSLTSVYRALNQLVESQIAKPLNFNDGQVRYELNTHHSHHHHVICTNCNTVQMLDWCPFEMITERLAGSFKMHYHNFEVFGLCLPCQEDSAHTTATPVNTHVHPSERH